MGKKTNLALGATAVMVTLTIPHMQRAEAATSVLNISASIISTINLSVQASMHFGNIGPSGANADTVVLATDGSISTVGGFADTLGGHIVGAIEIAAAPNATVNLGVATATVVLTDGPNSMNAKDFVIGYAGDTDGQVVLNTAGTGSLRVGGSLEVAANQAPGTYSGTVSVTVNYN